MKHFGIIVNTEKEGTIYYGNSLKQYIEQFGCTCTLSKDGSDLPAGTECGIVVGGDGTLLRAAKVVLDRQIPLLGVNMGTLGYLAEVEAKQAYPAIDLLLADHYTLQNRMMIHGRVIRDGEEIFSDTALNDIVLQGEKQIRAYEFNSYVNNTYLTTYHADGIILATPTGSTGYSLSAGGPIVAPDANILMMTPVASHSLIARSILFSGSDMISVEIGEGRVGEVHHVASVSFDGGNVVHLSTNDTVEVRRSVKATQFIKLNNISFLDTLRRKMAHQ